MAQGSCQLISLRPRPSQSEGYDLKTLGQGSSESPGSGQVEIPVSHDYLGSDRDVEENVEEMMLLASISAGLEHVLYITF